MTSVCASVWENTSKVVFLPAGPLYQALSSFHGAIISVMLKCVVVLIDILLMNELS